MNEHASQPETRPWGRTVLPVALGQAVSLLGSGLSEFALGLWVYQRTQSVTQFAFVLLFRTLPVIALSPLAGVLADRWDRRRVMILSDTGSALCSLLLAALLLTGQLQVWQVCALTAASAAFGALQTPAYLAAIADLVPVQSLGRVNGWLQVSQATTEILVPFLAASLLSLIELPGILTLDVATFAAALVTLAGARFGMQSAPRAAPPSGGLAFFLDALRYLRGRADLTRLLTFNAAFAFLVGMLSPLLIPLFTGLTSVEGMGLVLTIGGGGFLGGSLLMSARGGLRSYRTTILVGSAVFGLALATAGLVPDIGWVGVGVFVAHFALPFVQGSSQALWQSAIGPEIQGRLQAVRQLVLRGLQPVALILAGLAADRVFEPALMAEAPLARSFGAWVGVGPGRGTAILVACIGAATLAISLVAIASRGWLQPAVAESTPAHGSHRSTHD